MSGAQHDAMDPEWTTTLRATPEVVAAAVAGLSDRAAARNEGPGTWSVRDVVAHLCDLEVTDWMPRVMRVVESPGSVFPPVNREAFRESLHGVALPDLVDLFRQRRLESLETLQAMDLTGSALALEAVHPALGPVTLRQLLATWVVHDLTHVAQIARILATSLRSSVGPWAEYLSILGDLDRRSGQGA